MSSVWLRSRLTVLPSLTVLLVAGCGDSAASGSSNQMPTPTTSSGGNAPMQPDPTTTLPEAEATGGAPSTTDATGSNESQPSDITPATGDAMLEPGMDEPMMNADGKLGVFVAQGHLARTVISCDGGRSWIHDRADVTDDRCWTDNGIECDHQPTSGRGITFGGDGQFYATFGWGNPGSIRRSNDGASWDPVHEGSSFGGIAFGAGTYLAGSKNSLISTDGENWEAAGDTNLAVHNVRRVGFVAHEEGRFILVGGDSGQTDVVLSSDGGKSWWHPDSVPGSCGDKIQTQGGIAYGNGTIVIVGGDGNACASSDGGQNWEANRVGADDVSSHLVFDGEQFFVWGSGTAYHSSDGRAWTSTPTMPEVHLGPTAYGDGSYVGVLGGWNNWYEKQEFYRSDDGINWEVIGGGGFGDAGHPIRDMAFGRLEPTQECQ